MWGPWAMGMATSNTISRFGSIGLEPFEPGTGLLILEAALEAKLAELVAASFNWKQVPSTPIFKRAIFAGLIDHWSLEIHEPIAKVLIPLLTFVLSPEWNFVIIIKNLFSTTLNWRKNAGPINGKR